MSSLRESILITADAGDAAVGAGAVPVVEAGQVVVAQVGAGALHAADGGLDEVRVDELALGAAVVEVVDFDEVGGLAGELLVAEGVDLELLAGDLFGLGAVAGFEVDDDGVAGVGVADEVDAAVDDDAVGELELDGFFDVLELVEVRTVAVQVVGEGFLGGLAGVVPHFLAGKGEVEVGVDEAGDVVSVGDVAADGFGVDFGEGVVEGFAVADGLADGFVEAVEEAELEAVGAVEVVLELAEGEGQGDLFAAGPGREAVGLGREGRLVGEDVGAGRELVVEFGDLFVEVVVGNG